MGLTIVQDGRAEVSGSTSRVHLTVTFDSSYPTGGEAFDADDYGFGRMVSISIANKASNGFVASYDAANKKMMLFEVLLETRASPPRRFQPHFPKQQTAGTPRLRCSM